MRKIKLFMTTLMLALGFTAYAQNITVSGVITDENGPVPGATVMIPGTTTGTATDLDGKYTLTVPANANIMVSCVGYVDITENVDGRNVINFRLKSDSTLLEETVVIGYGSGQKVSNLVGSVTTVKSEAIKSSPAASPLDALQGQVAGLSVLTTGGVAGDNNVSMTLHGVGSLSSGTAPLFVIDGIPSSSRTIMAMNPNDIVSVSVLKDASATSIYGSRAANGVVYVTTRAGSYDTKATVTARSQFGISTLADFTMWDNMMTGQELLDFWARSGMHSPTYLQETYADHGYTYNTDWTQYFQQFNNPQSQNDVTIEGGGRKTAYAISASQFHQRGNTIGNVYDRYTVRSNVQGVPKDWLKVGMNLNLSLDKRTTNGNWGSGSSAGGNNYLSGGLSMMNNPLYPAIDPITGDVYKYQFPGIGLMNYSWLYPLRHGQSNRYGLVGSVFVQLEPIRNLIIMSRAGIDGNINLWTYTSYPSVQALFPDNTAGRDKSSELYYQATVTNTIEYKFGFGQNHRFSVLAGQEGISMYDDYFNTYAANQTDDRLVNLQNGTQASFDMEESHTDMATLSFFTHADYTAFDKYIFDVTFRYDASSRFGRDVRWAPFWSVGALWKMKKENFLKDVTWLNDLNFKISYGTQGNSSIGDYLPYATISAGSFYADKGSLYVSGPSNYDLSWEQQGLFTATLSGRVFDRVDFDFEVYDRRTDDMLMDVPQPYTTGFTSLTQNVGSLSNKGVDITLGVDVLRGRDYFLRFNTTFNYNQQKITALFDGRDRWTVANTGITYVVGQPVSFYYPIYAGVDPADGQMMWYIPGENVDITTMDPEKVTKTFDETTLEQNTGYARYAPINGGFSLSGGWRGISFLADFSYVLGKRLINNDAFFYCNPNQFDGYNQSRAVSDFWTPEHRNARFPDWSNGTTMQFDTHLLEDASFMRLKSFQVAYDLPQSLLRWTNGVLGGVRFTFTGRNLFTLTNYMGSDPEANSNLVLGLPGSSKQYLGGIELTF